MGFGVRGVTVSQLTALLSIVSTFFVTGCSTAFSTADDLHADDVPANYRTQIADFMRTQRDLFGLLPITIQKPVVISDPYRKPIGRGISVCVRDGDTGNGILFDFSTVRLYIFIDGQLQSDTGDIISQAGKGRLRELVWCGEHPSWKRFLEAEAEFQPRPRPEHQQ
jgi:hypothetical protein